MHCVMETDPFARQAKLIGLSDDDRLRIATILSENPTLGDLILEAGGARKFRYAKPGRGKSTGYRIITYFGGEDVPVFLLDVLDKGQRLNLTQGEKQELRKVLGGIAEDYRKSVAEKVARISEAS